MSNLISVEVIAAKILEVRGKKVILDRHLAKLYGVGTRDLNKAVKRNIMRFPGDFMYQLTRQEVANLMSILEHQVGVVTGSHRMFLQSRVWPCYPAF